LGKTLNVKLTTSDRASLGAWLIFSDPFYQSLRIFAQTPPFARPSPPPHLRTALRTHPTILFLHGAAGNRASPNRRNFYHTYPALLSTHVFAPDYRGFGDSDSVPSQAGLARDARTAWDWLMENGAIAEDVLVVGHSLGAAVAAELVAQLEREGSECRGLVLLAPFSSLRVLLDTYKLFGVWPVVGPLLTVPGAPGGFL
jgi:abhydrolase domain-containing protein 12